MFDFFGSGNSFSLKTLNEELKNMPSGTTEINVHINSGGGLVSEGFAIYDKLVSLQIPVNTIVEGMCGSIATIIAQAGKKGKRKMFQNSEYFIHNPLWIPSAPDAHSADDLEKLTEDLRKNEEKILDFYVKTTGSDKVMLSEKMQAETTLTSQEALQMGFIDEVINTDVVAMVKYKIAAAVELKQTKTNIMAELKDEIKAGFSKLESLFTAFTKGKTVNAAQMLADGTQIYSDTEEIAVGSKLFTDEAMTIPVADGDIVIDGGKTVTVAGGVVTAISEVVAKKTDLEIANEKIAALEAQVAAKEAELVTAKKEVETINSIATELQTEFVNLKSKIETGGNEIFATVVNKGGEPHAKKDWKTIAAERRIENSK